MDLKLKDFLHQNSQALERSEEQFQFLSASIKILGTDQFRNEIYISN